MKGSSVLDDITKSFDDPVSWVVYNIIKDK
jgi:hypothetical protein